MLTPDEIQTVAEAMNMPKEAVEVAIALFGEEWTQSSLSSSESSDSNDNV